jgi:hypothetical protein
MLFLLSGWFNSLTGIVGVVTLLGNFLNENSFCLNTPPGVLLFQRIRIEYTELCSKTALKLAADSSDFPS